MCEISFDGTCEIWREKKVRARKDHKCSSCGSMIRIGENYVKHFSVYEGEPTMEKCCMLCEGSRAAFEEEHNVYITPSYLTEMLSECIDSGDSEDPKRWQSMLDSILARRHPEVGSSIRSEM